MSLVPKRIHWFLHGPIALALILAVSDLPALAQDSGKEPPKKASVAEPSSPPPKTEVIRLKYVKASDAHRIISELFRGKSTHYVSADERTNSLIIIAHPGEIEQIAELIKKVDVNRPAMKDPTPLQVYHLKNRENVVRLEEILKMLFPTCKFAFTDKETLIAYGDPETLQMLEALLVRLEDQAGNPLPEAESQIRIVWLAAGSSLKDAPKPPDDLNEVVAELAKVGVENPRLVSQIIVNAAVNTRFTVHGNAKLVVPWQLVIQGTMTVGSRGNPSLEISIDASRLDETKGTEVDGRDSRGPSGPRSPRPPQVAKLDTKITAPPGHSVVLGLTPFDGTTSAFVIQVLPKKATMAKPPR
jgi:hypothetical protein